MQSVSILKELLSFALEFLPTRRCPARTPPAATSRTGPCPGKAAPLLKPCGLPPPGLPPGPAQDSREPAFVKATPPCPPLPITHPSPAPTPPGLSAAQAPQPFPGPAPQPFLSRLLGRPCTCPTGLPPLSASNLLPLGPGLRWSLCQEPPGEPSAGPCCSLSASAQASKSSPLLSAVALPLSPRLPCTALSRSVSSAVQSLRPQNLGR